MKITRSLLSEWQACWSADRYAAIEKLIGKSPTLRAVAGCESISLDDRLWVVARALWHIDPDHAALWAVECAEDVAHLAGDEDDQAVYAGILNETRRILCDTVRGSDEREAALRDLGAARGAARGAAWDAARGAARGAAWGAVRDAAWGAAWGAARDAAWNAAMGAAWDAAILKHINRALEFLGTEAD